MSTREWFEHWPRSLRLALFIVILIVTVIGAIPGIIVGLGYVLGIQPCDAPNGTGTSTGCNNPELLVFVVVLIAIGIPAARLWTRMLVDALGLHEKEGETAVSKRERNSIAKQQGEMRSISSGIVAGSVELDTRSAHTVFIGGVRLIFWSVYAIRKGRIKKGDNSTVAYQGTPLKGVNLALAYWDANISSPRCVAGIVQSMSALIALGCILSFAWFNPPFSRIWISLCTALITSNVAYLALALRAKARLSGLMGRKGVQ